MWGPSYLSLTKSISLLLMPCGSLHCHTISSHDIDYVNKAGRISSTCVMSVWRNDVNFEYKFMFLQKNLARKELTIHWCAILIAHQIVMAKHGGSCVHFSEISTCRRTSRETVSHPQCPPLPTLCKISLPIYVIVTNKLLQPLTTTWFD